MYNIILLFTFTLISLSVFSAEDSVKIEDDNTSTQLTEDTLPVKQQPKEIIIDSIQSLFTIMSAANKSINHQSLLTYEANGFITTFKLFHSVDDNSVSQKLMFMDGPKRQVVSKQSIATCSDGHTSWGLWPSVFSPNALANYKLKAVDVERIANREALVFDLLPTDSHRYGYRYSIDRQTGLVLKAVTYFKSSIIERLQTISIAFDLNSEEPKEALSYTWRVPELDPCNSTQYTPAWGVDWLPDGFVSMGNRITAQGEQVLMFSDGLVSISVFIVKSSKGERLVKATAKHGATVVVLAPFVSDPLRGVAVVGEVPTATARKIAVSVKELN